MDIYLHNKYTNIYYNIVNNAIGASRSKSDNKLYEKHHIIPKSCGGDNSKDNLVLLTPKEHYICHRLLPKMVKTKIHYEKMIYALWCLINGNGHSSRHSTSSRIYQQVKETQTLIRSQRMKGNKNHFYGKKHSVESKIKMSENNATKRDDVKAKLRGPRTGFLPHNYFNGWSEEVKEKLRIANLGKRASEETKRKMSLTRSNKIWIKKAGEKSKHIQNEFLEYYVELGWTKGRK